jgi:ABC-type multidrug transport system fused ATPase/permease subunit
LVALFLELAALLSIPIFIGDMIAYIDPTKKDPLIIDSGIGTAFAIFGLLMLSICARSAFEMTKIKLFKDVQSFLLGALYQKSLLLSCKARLQYPPGKILNMANADTTQVIDAVTTLPQAISIPFQIILTGLFLWRLLGIAALVGLASLFVLLIAASANAGIVSKYIGEWIKWGDKRVQSIRELLVGIKIVKFQAMEDYFFAKIASARDKQVGFLKKALIFIGAIQILVGSSATVMAVLSFTIYSLNNQMDASIIFPALLYLKSLTMPVFDFSNLLTAVLTGRIALQRIEQFLNSSEAEKPSFEDSKRGVVSLLNVTSDWSENSVQDSEKELVSNGEKFEMKNLTIDIPAGSLTAIVGDVASGKSSFLATILGDTNLRSGNVSVHGKVAYCSQEPWIKHGTVKENILFGAEMDETRLANVVNICSLESDFKLLSSGINTEIGEGGSNLSGGQRARIALARAIYSDADIYLLDCPLAALDAKVASQIFQNAIQGGLANKTVLFATHKRHLLSKVDKILVLKKGTIAHFGTYAELGSVLEPVDPTEEEEKEESLESQLELSIQNEDDENESEIVLLMEKEEINTVCFDSSRVVSRKRIIWWRSKRLEFRLLFSSLSLDLY